MKSDHALNLPAFERVWMRSFTRWRQKCVLNPRMHIKGHQGSDPDGHPAAPGPDAPFSPLKEQLHPLLPPEEGQSAPKGEGDLDGSISKDAVAPPESECNTNAEENTNARKLDKLEHAFARKGPQNEASEAPEKTATGRKKAQKEAKQEDAELRQYPSLALVLLRVFGFSLLYAHVFKLAQDLIQYLNPLWLK